MTRVCLVGEDDLDLRAELLSSETARHALESYDLTQPYENTVAVETISIGAAVSLLNDLDWYLRRFTADALVLEPSVDRQEWLSRALATAIRNEEIKPQDTAALLKIYGVVEGEYGDRLTEPMFAQRVEGVIPSYDLRPVDATLVIRVTEPEFGTS